MDINVFELKLLSTVGGSVERCFFHPAVLGGEKKHKMSVIRDG